MLALFLVLLQSVLVRNCFAVIHAGLNHAFALQPNGQVFAWGNNQYGQLGNSNPHIMDSGNPELVIGISSALDACAGSFHNCYIDEGQVLKCNGRNNFGQLGDNTLMDRFYASAVIVSSSIGPSRVFCGDSHTCAVFGHDTMMCWGYNSHGQLGAAGVTSHSVQHPITIKTPNLVVHMAGGTFHTCIVTTTMAAFCVGKNTYGELGDGTKTPRVDFTPVFGLANDVATLACSSYHTCAIVASSGAVQCWGRGRTGELGNRALLDSPTPVNVIPYGALQLSLGATHTCVLVSPYRNALCWGSGANYKLGTFAKANRDAPTDFLGGMVGILNVASGGTFTCITYGMSASIGCVGLVGVDQYGEEVKSSTPRRDSVALRDVNVPLHTRAGREHKAGLFLVTMLLFCLAVYIGSLCRRGFREITKKV